MSAALVLVGLVYATRDWWRPLSVVVENEGPTALRDVQVFVTGDSATVERIEPGASARVRVRPTGDSHVELGGGSLGDTRLVADTYLMRGSKGTVRIVVDRDSVTVVKHASP